MLIRGEYMVLDPDEYVKRLNDEYEEVDDDDEEGDDRALPQSIQHSLGGELAERQLQTGMNQVAGASGYSGYESDGLNYSKDMFQDDTLEGVLDFLRRMKLTTKVQNKLAEMYMIFSSKDYVLTWSNGFMLKDSIDRVKLDLLEFKNTLIGQDSDCLLFSDYDLVMETFVSRLRTRYSRSYEGFERRAVVSQINITQDLTHMPDQADRREEASGLRKLGHSMPFGRY